MAAIEGFCSPTPDGRPLVLAISCSTRRSAWGLSTNRHEVVIDAGWRLRVPHDVEAERVGVALGGYLTCLEVADRVLPAVRELFGLACRDRLPELARNGFRLWGPARPATGCCLAPSVGYSGPVEAAEHVRSVRHVAGGHGAEKRLVVSVFAAVMRAHGYRQEVPFPEREARLASACVPAHDDLRLLWRAGVSPSNVVRVYEALGSPERRPSVSYYLGMLTRRPDLVWLAGGAAGSGDWYDAPTTREVGHVRAR